MTKDITKYLEKVNVPEFKLVNDLYLNEDINKKYTELIESLKPYEEQENLEINLTEEDVRHSVNKGIEKSLTTLSEKEQDIVRKRNSLDEYGRKKYTLREIAGILEKTPERIRQIEQKAYRKLKHPTRERLLLHAFNESILEKIGEKNPALFRNLYYNLDAVKGRNQYLEEQVKELQDKIKSFAKQYKDGLKNIFGEENINELYKEEEKENILNKSIDELELSVRAYNALKYSASVKSIGEFVDKTEHELLRAKNLGRRSLNEIKEELSKLGLNLRGGKSENKEPIDYEQLQLEEDLKIYLNSKE